LLHRVVAAQMHRHCVDVPLPQMCHRPRVNASQLRAVTTAADEPHSAAVVRRCTALRAEARRPRPRAYVAHPLHAVPRKGKERWRKLGVGEVEVLIYFILYI
jgi:hypothetical protein